MESAAVSSPKATNRPTFACIRCSDRKVRCDRQHPCGACVRHNVECVFRPTPPPASKTRRKRKKLKDDSLNDRIHQYEALLRQQGIDPSQLPSRPPAERRPRQRHSEGSGLGHSPQLPTPASTTYDTERSTSRTQGLQGEETPKFSDNPLWTRVAEEAEDAEDASETSTFGASWSGASEDDFHYVLDTVPRPRNKLSHPSSDQMNLLWQVFIDNIDPVTKIIHVPTLQPAIEKATANTRSVPRSFEALLFAIYSTAVMSMKDSECKEKLGEPRKGLLSRYVLATKSALSRAKFMGSRSLVVLQALLLHLTSVQAIYDPFSLWTLTGVAMRIAEAIGLHREGTSLGLPPFEAEIRRRIWWALQTMDGRNSEACGFARFRHFDIGFDQPKPPANVDDRDLYPGMSEPPTESSRATDAVFCVMRASMIHTAIEYGAKAQRERKDNDVWDNFAPRDDIVAKMESLLETKFISVCDPSRPLHLMTVIFARSAMNIGRFKAHHPRRWTAEGEIPESEKQLVWDTSIQLLEQYDMMQTSPQLQRFAWFTGNFLNWHALVHVLDTIRANPLMPDASRIWQLIESTYNNNTQDIIFNAKSAIHIAIGNLCLKAFEAREQAFSTKNKHQPPTPEFIVNLRKEREMLRARRTSRDTNSRQSKTSPMAEQLDRMKEHSMLSATAAFPYDTSVSNEPLQLMGSNQARDNTAYDSFWFMNGFEDQLTGDPNSIMDIDTDLMLSQGQIFDNVAHQTVDWTQWDAWLGSLNKSHLGLGMTIEDSFARQSL